MFVKANEFNTHNSNLWILAFCRPVICNNQIAQSSILQSDWSNQSRVKDFLFRTLLYIHRTTSRTFCSWHCSSLAGSVAPAPPTPLVLSPPVSHSYEPWQKNVPVSSRLQCVWEGGVCCGRNEDASVGRGDGSSSCSCILID